MTAHLEFLRETFPLCHVFIYLSNKKCKFFLRSCSFLLFQFIYCCHLSKKQDCLHAPTNFLWQLCTGTIVKNANALKWNNDHTIFYYVRGLLISLLLPVFDERYNKDILLCVLSCFMSNRRIICRQVMPDLGWNATSIFVVMFTFYLTCLQSK